VGVQQTVTFDTVWGLAPYSSCLWVQTGSLPSQMPWAKPLTNSPTACIFR